MPINLPLAESFLHVPALAELSGVPRRTIQELEVRNDGRVSTMIKLADALGVSLDELCRDPDDSDDGEPV